jgi:outer membrane protein assembly factor BamE (lipoprotein component of BamABCDE complex)
MTLKHVVALAVGICSSTLAGCMSASEHRAAVEEPAGERLTVGTVQKEIRVGMSGAEVAAVLGSPNIVSTDEERREVWIYDKIATDVAYSSSSGGIASLILGGSGSVAGGVSGNANQSAGASSTSQRTLTVIIKFDNDKKVRDFAYHTSRF